MWPGMHCTDCGYNCHEKCVQHVPKNCTKVHSSSHLTSLAAAASKAHTMPAAESGTDKTLVGSTTQPDTSVVAGTSIIHYCSVV